MELKMKLRVIFCTYFQRHQWQVLERKMEGCLVQLWCTLLFVFAILINMEQLSKLLKLVLFLPEIPALQIDVVSVSCGGVLEGKRL